MRLLDILILLPKSSHFTLEALTDCSILTRIFKGEFTPLPAQNGLPRRHVTLHGHNFVEVITHQSPQRLCYQIQGQGPVKQHHGEISLIYTCANLQIRYQIFGFSNTWLPTWLLKLVIFVDFNLAARRLRKLYHEC
ncbi:hypothetical protein PSECIP111951_03109 [Pseudoalteromonas holothuriae]|uniref:SRPBCC family protein n=1 Tax=Pseudoalteromonas holothuriae TaxID=2963714 RepID=A0A9W4QYC8_9GAMM|nr:hypothetical protein [Pseudoalteromonas sp. CIP111951]CAH9059451.1 hypothetical protein PSECIP111854_02409 [Pseudoalteromonas sp. CIP111854]CAH9064344.1 hypothetical protein PSECIP111951_03109 [Pseudoalteromonas sp. CIP111951]